MREVIMNTGQFGQFLAQLRKNKNLKQIQVAEYVGTTFKNISRWETGISIPDSSYLAKLSEIYEVDIEELLNGEINYKKRNKIKKQKLINKIIKILLCIIIPIFIFLLIYFCIEFNSYKVIQILSKTENNIVEGYITQKNNNLLFNFSIIQVDGYYIKTDDYITIEIYYNDILIYSANEAYISFNLKNNIELTKIKIKANVSNDTKNYEDSINLKYKDVTKNKNNNQINAKKANKQNKDITQKLLDYGFEEYEEGKYRFIDENNNTVEYSNSNELLNIITNNPNYYESIKYYYNSEKYNVSIYNISKSNKILLEKYNYNSKTKELDCIAGSCASIDDTLKIMQPYIILINGE